MNAHVERKCVLLLLDNFEQVVEAAPVVSSLLAETPNAKMIVTSREPLHVDSEQRYPVEPLPEGDAVTLFIERAQAVDPAFVPHPAVEAICVRLDGLPLAIELAAARVALLEPEELLERLVQRLPLLTSRSHGAPERQRTLRATIEWSYELLEPAEQDLFRRLGIFRGSFSLDGAEAVCGCDLDLVESLVLKSLVRRWDGGRLGMLDTIREYAVEALEASPDADDIGRAHAEHFLRVAEDANMNAHSFDFRKQMLYEVVVVEQDNLRGALAWAVKSGNLDTGLRIAAGLEQFWVLTDPDEGRRWFSRLFEQPGIEEVPIEIRADSMRAWGSSTDIAGDIQEAGRRYEASLALYEELDDELGRAVLVHRLSLHAVRRGTSNEHGSWSGSPMRPMSGTTTSGVWRRLWAPWAPSSATLTTPSGRASSSSRAWLSRRRSAISGGRVECSPSSPSSISRLGAPRKGRQPRSRRWRWPRRYATVQAASSASDCWPARRPSRETAGVPPSCGARSRTRMPERLWAAGGAIAKLRRNEFWSSPIPASSAPGLRAVS